MAEIDFLKLHKDKVEERKELNDRRVKDYELGTSYKYTMVDLDNQQLKGVIHTTMNRLRVFKAYVLAALAKADERIVVETEDESLDTATVEDFIRRSFRSADLKLFNRGDFGLDPFLDEQACMNGELSTRVLVQQLSNEEGEYLDIDLTSWDTRFITYEVGENGLAFHGNEQEQTKGMIAAEPWAIETNFTITGDKATVIDLWTPEENTIYVEDAIVYSQANPYGIVPVCVQKVPIGTMMPGEDSLKYQMESIYFLVRDLIDEYNRCLSILQTLNLLAIKGAITEVTSGEVHGYDEVTAPGSVTPVETPNAIQQVPIGEARRAMVLALQEINRAMDDGTLARIMLGDLPTGGLSAVALVQVEQGQGQVYMPRLGTRGLEKMQIAQMIIHQIQTLGISSFEIGTPGHKKAFKLSNLDGEYSIDFKYTNKSPETDFARLSMATQYKASGLMDDLTILTDVMKKDDPEGDLRKVHRQELRLMSPTLQLYDGATALLRDIEDGDESASAEFDIVEAELGVNLDQILAGNIPQAQPQKEKPVTQEGLLPTGGKSSAKKATDLIASPEEEGE